MRLLIVAVGQRVPDWAQTAWDDYAKRFPHDLKLELRAVKTEPRASKTVAALYAAERSRIEGALPKGCRIVALDERGSTLTTQGLASKLQQWQLEGDDVALVIGANDVTRHDAHVSIAAGFRREEARQAGPANGRNPVWTGVGSW